MKRGRFILQGILFTLIFLQFKSAVAQTISPLLFGVNAWMPDTIGDVNNCQSPPCIKYGKLHQNWQKVGDSKASIVRYGGIAPDKNMPTHYQYIRMIDSIRAHGMEPMIQVPFWNYRYSAQDAANIVQYVNVTMGRNIKYWIIANEPNLSYSYSTASQIAAYFKQFASAMKAVDPGIKIVGPETASFKYTITNGLTTPGGADDITGKDPNGNYYLDVFTFHTYPFGDGSTSTRPALIAELMGSGNFYDDVNYVKNRLATCNAYHSRTGDNKLEIGITEVSVNYTNPANDDLYGYGTYSFLGAQFVAEMYGIGMKTGTRFINLWSVIEGNSITSNCGYIDKYTSKKRPLYYHFQMMAENLRGTNVNCTLNQANAKAFASEDSSQVCVFIMNQDASVNHTYTVRLNTGSIAGSSTLKINANANIQAEYTDVIQNQSTLLLVFNKSGNLVRKCEYTLANHAVNGLPPSCTPYMTTSVLSAVQGIGALDVNLFPNPTSGALTIELTSTASGNQSYSLEVLNLVGETVYARKASFADGRETLQLEGSLARGVYVVRVAEGTNYVAKKIILQ
jgi:hypothetical protein